MEEVEVVVSETKVDKDQAWVVDLEGQTRKLKRP